MALAHGRTHVAMLNYGLRRHDRREIVSQLLRLAVAAPRHMDRALPRLATPAVPTSSCVPSSQCLLRHASRARALQAGRSADWYDTCV
jgi:hypothetical protein